MITSTNIASLAKRELYIFPELQPFRGFKFSIDPERDSVADLKKWADRFQVDPVNWWLLTGDKKTIYDLSVKYMNLTIQDPRVDSLFPHTDIFVLIDKHGVIRVRRDKAGNPLHTTARIVWL